MAWVVTAGNKQVTKRKDVLLTLSEETVDDNSKDLVYNTDIGFGDRARFTGIRIAYVATATAGTRTIVMRVLDSAGDTVRELRCTVTITAGQTQSYDLAPGNVSNTGTPNLQPMPSNFYLLPGQTLRFLDSANVAAADDLIIYASAVVEF